MDVSTLLLIVTKCNVKKKREEKTTAESRGINRSFVIQESIPYTSIAQGWTGKG